MRNIPASAILPGHPDYEKLEVIRDEIVQRLQRSNPKIFGFPGLVREAMDFVLAPVETARTQLRELDNVEKTFIGLKLEHLVRHLLDVPKGAHRDLQICGQEVDIKNTVRENWTIPEESYRDSEPCLLMAIDEECHTCFLGLILAKSEYLNPGKNRDSKRTISRQGFENILWILKDEPFPRSHFDGLDMDRFRALRKIEKSGTRRVAQFFRENLRRVVHREVVESLLSDQRDPMKRIRANGGAPDILKHEEIAILIGTFQKDKVLAKSLGIPNFMPDQIVSIHPRDELERSAMRDAGVIL